MSLRDWFNNLKGHDMASRKKNYEEWSMEDLRAEAGKREIEGRSSMNKSEMVDALRANDNNTLGETDPTAQTNVQPTQGSGKVPAETDKLSRDDTPRPVGEMSQTAPPRDPREMGSGRGDTKKGTLYAVEKTADATQVRLQSKDGRAGDSCAFKGGDPKVTLNGNETHLDDLRRGDELELVGDPVQEIIATRPR